MSLFDDDFYSPKVPLRERKGQGFGKWPSWRVFHWLSPRSALIIFAAIALLLVIVFLVSLWVGSLAGGNRPPGPIVSEQPISVVGVVEKMKPAIVSVISLQPGWGFESEDTEEQDAAVGSGIIYKKEGRTAKVVTNHHVIDGATSIEVVLSNGQRLKANLVGSDILSDLAVLEIDANKVSSVAEFGDSSQLREGEAAVAVGHPFGLGYSPTFTLGIISSMSRVIPISLAMDGNFDWEMELLQTDAAINHGNSGGALVNLEGKVIGINSMKVSQPGVEGLGFAIPSNAASPIIEELETYGKVRRPYMGVATVDLRSYRGGGDIDEVLNLPPAVKEGIIVLESYGPALEAGLRTNDVIVALDGKAVSSTLSLRKYLYAAKNIGDPIQVEYYRGGKEVTVILQLSENP